MQLPMMALVFTVTRPSYHLLRDLTVNSSVEKVSDGVEVNHWRRELRSGCGEDIVLGVWFWALTVAGVSCRMMAIWSEFSGVGGGGEGCVVIVKGWVKEGEENRLEGAIPFNLGNCQRLLLLTLSDNNLNGSIPRQLLTVSLLSIRVDIARNCLSRSLPLEVGNLKNIGEIDISENGLSDEITGTLGGCSSLENLYLQQNSFQGSIPSSLESLRGPNIEDP
ncbi:hypothetical protein RHGRI_010349 [Rhododendron griersonianum]|uniref:Uncharacterized protein n=1 Tax=Rhododendron griersonianum TaxID=479676 RepID=A0AAV6KIW3_9ERIC|nr:hypothetical protein RHGRI_010349 [Rhododendron griersonianum]